MDGRPPVLSSFKGRKSLNVFSALGLKSSGGLYFRTKLYKSLFHLVNQQLPSALSTFIYTPCKLFYTFSKNNQK